MKLRLEGVSRLKQSLLLASSLLATSIHADVVTVEGDKIKAGDLVVGTASTCTDDSGRTYQVLTFTSTAQTWEWAVPSGVTTLDYLVVGGGGGGGYQYGGGGGGGGVLTNTSPFAVDTGDRLTVKVGAGGAGAVKGETAGGMGADSELVLGASVRKAGGGGGGATINYPGLAGKSGTDGLGGGSGGGGSQGSAGGAGKDGGFAGGGNKSPGGSGGGGAGSVGLATDTLNTSSGKSGDGGCGVTSEITGVAIVYAGGGGGGGADNGTKGTKTYYKAGGVGRDGGGDGGSRLVDGDGNYAGEIAATPGVDGLGGGGGGGAHGATPKAGAKGGDGVVILRYLRSTKTALTSVTLSSSGSTYDGNSHQSSIVISEVLDADGKPVNSDAYSVAYQRDGSDVTDWTSAGEIVVKVTAKDDSDYSGTVWATYAIERAVVTSLAFKPSSFTHDGETKRPEVTVRAGTMTLAASDYDVTAGAVEGSELGTYDVTVTGNGNFKGTARASWSIVSCQHAYEQIPPKSPTCTEDGWADDGWRCKTCGVTNVLPTVLAALGHDWTDWTVTTPATLTAEGVQERDCLRCGQHEAQSVPTIGWTFYPEKDSGYSGGTGTYTDGIISNSVGQILNVYFETGSTANLVVGAKKTLPDGNYYMAVNPRCAVTNVIDLTGGVKNCEDSSKRYALTQIGQFAFYSYSDTKVERYLKFRPAVDKILLPEELEVIANNAFGTSTADKRLKEIGYAGTRLTTISESAFRHLQVLKSDIQSFFTDALTSVGKEAFAWCYGMTGRLDTRNVASFPENAFVHMKNVKDVYLTKVEELNTGAFGAYFEGKVTFHFRNDGATLKGAGVFGHTSASTLRMLFPLRAPSMNETGCSLGAGIFRGGNNLWTKGKHTYLVFDRTLTETDRESLGWKTLCKVAQAADATAFSGATIDTSINGVTKETVAADLECEPADVELYGVYETANQTHALAIVGVDPAYFSTETDYTWVQSAGGDWASGANWSPIGVPDGGKKTAKFLTHWSDELVTVTSDSDRTLKAILFSESETLLDFGGHELKGPAPHTLALDAQGADVGFRSGTFAFTNSWFTGDRTLSVLGGANVSFTGDGNQTVRGTPATYVAPLDFYWVHYPSGKEVKEDTHPNVVVSDGGSLTVAASPGTAALSDFMLKSVWGRGEVDGGTLAYANNGDTSATMTFTNGLVVTGGGSVTGASKLVLKGGATLIDVGTTVDFTTLQVDGLTKGAVSAAKDNALSAITLASAAAGTELTFSGIALGDVNDSASRTTLTFGDGSTGSGNLNGSGMDRTIVFDGGTFTVPDGKTFALGTSPTIKFVLPVDGYATAPLTVQCSGALGDGTVIAIDSSQYKGTSYAGGVIPLAKMASAITNLDALREDATGIPSGMQLALATGDSTMLVLAPSGYTVTFDANGGEPDKTYRSIAYDAQYGMFPDVTRQGYKFVGWFTAIEGGTQKYPFDKVTDTHTLYARWERTRGLILIFGPPVEP